MPDGKKERTRQIPQGQPFSNLNHHGRDGQLIHSSLALHPEALEAVALCRLSAPAPLTAASSSRSQPGCLPRTSGTCSPSTPCTRSR
jgi:hypothetical protein